MKVSKLLRYIKELKITGFRRLATHDKPAVWNVNNSKLYKTVQLPLTEATSPARLYDGSVYSAGSPVIIQKIRDIALAPRCQVCTAVLVRIRICCDVAPCLKFVVPDVSRKHGIFETSGSSDTAFFRHSWIISALLLTNITKVNRTWQQYVPPLQSANVEQGCCAVQVKLQSLQAYSWDTPFE